jgi:hypothetical protein
VSERGCERVTAFGVDTTLFTLFRKCSGGFGRNETSETTASIIEGQIDGKLFYVLSVSS